MKWSNFLIDPVFHYTLYIAQDWLSDNCIWCRTYEEEQMAHQMKNDEIAGWIIDWFMQHLSQASPHLGLLLFPLENRNIWVVSEPPSVSTSCSMGICQ